MCSENKDDKMEQEDEKAGENKLRSDSASILELTLEKIKDKSLNDIKELMDKNTLADFVIQTFQTQTEGRRFSLISLEPDFGKLYQNYIYQKCQKCGNSADKQDFALCLLCGYLCCVRKCGSSSLAIGSKFSFQNQLVVFQCLISRSSWKPLPTCCSASFWKLCISKYHERKPHSLLK